MPPWAPEPLVLGAWIGGLLLAVLLGLLVPRPSRGSWWKGILAVAFPSGFYTMVEGKAAVAEALSAQPDWALPAAHAGAAVIVHVFFGFVGLVMARALATDPETLERLELLKRAEAREAKERKERAEKAKRAQERAAKQRAEQERLRAERRAEREAAAAANAAPAPPDEPAAANASVDASSAAGEATESEAKTADDDEPEPSSADPAGAAEDQTLDDDEPADRSPSGGPSPAVAALIRPAAGTVAAGGDGERTRLLTALRHSPDPHRAASARAVALGWAGSDDPEFADALVAVVLDGAAAVAARSECWVALRAVLGEPLPADEAQRARQYFPEGLDIDWLEARGLGPSART